MGVALILLPIWWVSSSKTYFGARIGVQNYCSYSSQILNNDKDLQVLVEGRTKVCPTNPKWQTDTNLEKS